jgi:hypothetical protein
LITFIQLPGSSPGVSLVRAGSAPPTILLSRIQYHDIIPFSDQPENISNAPNVEAFLDRLEAVARHGYELLAPRRFAVLFPNNEYDLQLPHFN